MITRLLTLIPGGLPAALGLALAAGWGLNAAHDRLAPWGSHAKLAGLQEDLDAEEDRADAEKRRADDLQAQVTTLSGRERTQAAHESAAAGAAAGQCAAEVSSAFRRGVTAGRNTCPAPGA